MLFPDNLCECMVNANSFGSLLCLEEEWKKVEKSCRHDSCIQHVLDNNSDFSPLLTRLFRLNREEKKFSHVAIALRASANVRSLWHVNIHSLSCRSYLESSSDFMTFSSARRRKCLKSNKVSLWFLMSSADVVMSSRPATIAHNWQHVSIVEPFSVPNDWMSRRCLVGGIGPHLRICCNYFLCWIIMERSR